MRLSLLAVAAGLISIPLAARADLLGNTIHVTYDYPTATNTYLDLGNVVVPGGGAAVAPNASIATFTIGASQIAITDTLQQNFNFATFSGFEFTDISTDPGINGVTIDPLSTLITMPESQVTFTSNEVFVNLEGIGTVNPGQTLILDLTFAPAASTGTSTGTSVTPEPSSIALLGTGLLGLAGTMRRRFARS